MMPVCIRGTNFATEEGIKTHLRRLRCRGVKISSDTTCTFCQKTFLKFAGLRQHIKRAHPVEYNAELEDRYEQPNTASARVGSDDEDEEEHIKMAKIEAAYNGRFPNAHIRSLLPHLTIDQIKYRRKKDDYKILLETLRKGPQTMDLVEEINAETTIHDVGTLDTAFIVEEELLTLAEVSLWARPTEVFTNGSLNADNTESVPVEDSFRNILTVLAQKTGLYEAFVFLARLSNLPQSTERGRKLLEQLGTCIKSLPGRSTGQKRPKKVPTKTGYDLASLNRYKKRALCFKETQTAFERNRAELAKCILEDLPLSREEERPEVEAVEREYRGIFQRPSLEDTEKYGTPISAINLDYPITI
ncbi:uncharacterized protein LOC125505078, partial [Dendroctonus ponderosae]|uniref:uncharacterized protein LOC125505078 n=1 Tax=Dendroctonus ponderosae TaxID=77166 RepID=UPI002034FE45